MKKIPQVAIITRTKDRPVFLERAIQSVISQTYDDWVHVIVNDGGNPGPVDLLVKIYSESYNGRVKVITHEESLGMQQASNAGIRNSESVYLVVHDDDDSWYEGFLEKTVGYLEAAGSDSVFQGVVTQTTQVVEEMSVYGEVLELHKQPYYPFDFVGLEQMRKQNLFAPIAFLYRRLVHEKLGLFRQEFDVLGDHDFNLRFLRHFDIGVIPEFLAYYHWRHGSLGNTVTRSRETHRAMLNKLKNAYHRDLLDDPENAVGDISSIEMPPPDGPEFIPFNKRQEEVPEPQELPDFKNLYDFDVLSLDVFDTVLKRRCHRPKDVFILLEDRVEEVMKLPGLPIALAREKAERLARKTIRPEVTIAEIYEVMGNLLSLEKKEIETILSLELEIEKELQYGDVRWVELYNEYRDAGIRIIFVSDMYLDRSTISTLLEKSGFNEPEVYVSCEYQCSKSQGALYNEIAQDVGLKPDRVLHVGDNYHSDCIRAWQAGWQAFHLSLNFEYTPWFAQVDPHYFCPHDNLSTRMMGEVSRLGNESSGNKRSITEKLGCEVAGPLYLSFMLWVLKQAQKDGIRKLILLGRDGYYWKKSIDLLSGTTDSGVGASYVDTSRKVLNFASFRTLDEDALEFLLTPNPALSVTDFVARTGIDAENCHAQMRQAGFDDPGQILTTPMGGKFLENQYPEQLRNLFQLLQPQLEKLFDADRRGVEHLFKEVDFDPRDCAIVDIGWNASSANALSRLFKLNPPGELRAYYFGTWEKARGCKYPVSIKSYFFHYGQPLENAELIRESVNWIESINAAPYPTLVAFDEVNGIPEPVFPDTIRGGFSEDQQVELWNGAKAFLNAIINNLPSELGEHPGYSYLQLVLRRVLREPSPKEVAEWGKILHSEGFGIVSHTPLIKQISEDTYEDELMRAYWSSNWKRGFLSTLPEEKCQFITERARPGKTRTTDQLEADLKWRQKQVDAFWNEKEDYKKEIKVLQSRVVELEQTVENLKTDLHWKSGEAHALYNEKLELQNKLGIPNKKPDVPESD